MIIVADENMPAVNELFSSLGDVHLYPGREITADKVVGADILLVRSVTEVTPNLLVNSKIGFVGSATIGIDHVDLGYLSNESIRFSHAPGCNANAVAEYVCCALIAVLKEDECLSEKTAGIVGLGNVGKILYRKLEALGVKVCAFDPFQHLDDFNMVGSLGEISDRDVISFHVPLTRDGDYPTFHMGDKSFFLSLPESAILLNTARGAVFNNLELAEVLAERNDLRVILDVWENEPLINRDLLQKVAIGSPHIAGYSLDGKLKGTYALYEALCAHLNVEPEYTLAELFGEYPVAQPVLINTPELQLPKLLSSFYDIRLDDALLRRPVEDDGAYFDQLRKTYRVRREFSCYELPTGLKQGIYSLLSGLGFR